MGSKNVQLSISILLSKNIEAIKRCLASLDFLREEIACELILTDTSKQEEVHALAEEYADVLLEFEWCNDFAKARNVGLKKATGDWFLFLDDDEWIEDATPLIEFLKGQEEAQFDCVNYVQRNWHDEGGEHYSDFWVSRMIRRNENTHFESKIHEYLVPVTGDCKGLRLIVNHTGYIYKTEEEKRKHFHRNESLLREMMKEEPEALRWKTQLVQEYWAVREFADMIQICEIGIKQCKDKDEKISNRELGTFYAGLVAAYFEKRDFDKAMEWGEIAFADQRTSVVCRAYIRVVMANIHLERRNLDEAKAQIEAYLREKEFAESLGTQYENMKCAMIAGEAFDELTVKKAYSILILCGLLVNDTQLLRQYFHELHWENRSVYVMGGFMEPLIEAMASASEVEAIFVEVMECIFCNDALRKLALGIIPDYEERNKKKYFMLQNILAMVSSSHWYPAYCAVFVCERTNKELVPQAIVELVMKLPNVFKIPEDILAIAETHGITSADIYRTIPGERWKRDTGTFLSEASEEEKAVFEKEMLEMVNLELPQVDYAMIRLYENVALLSMGIQDFTLKRNALLRYAELGCQYAVKYYEKDIVLHASVLLPQYVGSAIFLKEALILEERDEELSLQYFKKLELLYPHFKRVVKNYLCEKKLEADEKRRNAKDEMHRLQESIICQAKELVQKGQYVTAMAILKDLQKICPDNLDVINAILEVRLGMIEEGE